MGSTATFLGNAAADTLTIDAAGGLLRHNRFTAGDPGFNSDFDFDSGVAGDQTLSAVTGSIQITPGAGPDVVNIGTPAVGLASLQGTFTVTASATTTLSVNDQAASGAVTYLVTATAITASSSPGTINYTSVGALTLNGGSGGDTFNVQSTIAGAITSVIGGIGNDTINVSSNAPLNTGVLTGLAGQLNVDGGGGSDTLNISESGSATPDTVVFDAGGSGVIFSSVIGWRVVLTGTALNGGDHISTGSAGDTINLQNSFAGVSSGLEPVFINTNGGNDVINVSSDAPANTGDFVRFKSPVTIDAGPGSNTLVMSESGAVAADNVTVTSGNVSSSILPFNLTYLATGGTFGGGFSLTTGAGNDTISVTSAAAGAPPTVNGGGGVNLVNVTPSAAAAINALGGPGITGNVLNFLGTCATITATTITSAGNQPVSYSQFSLIEINGTPTIAPTSNSFPVTGGTGTVGVTVPGGCSWSSISNTAFLTITGGASGTGSGTTDYSAASNSGGTARSGTLTVAGSTFDVSQAADTTAPVANPQTLTTSIDTPLGIVLTASDPDSPTLTFSIVTGPAHGVLSGLNAATGAVTYTPNLGYTGPDSFTFQASDGLNVSTPATISITVLPAAARTDVPALDVRGLIVLTLALAAAGALTLRRLVR